MMLTVFMLQDVFLAPL